MKFKLIHRQSEQRLILLFTGWGMDSRPFGSLVKKGYDTGIVWDYRDLSSPWIDEISCYEEITVIAWSFGVPAAADFIIRHPGLPVTARIAVNGTQHPVDDTLGIPCAIFNGTLESLSDQNLTRFHRRMCGGTARYKEFAITIPERETGELKDELQAIGSRVPEQIMWDKAFVAMNDLVIPPSAQCKAWEKEAYMVRTFTGPHLPDFKAFIETVLTDKRLVERRFSDVCDTYDANATVQHHIADRLLESVSPGGRILEIGCGTGYATARLAEIGKVEAWDLTISPQVAGMVEDERVKASACDAETAVWKFPDNSVETLFSASTVQWFNSLPAFIRQARRIVKPGGRVIISTFGPRTMEEIHTLIGSTTSYPSLREVARIADGGEVKEEIITLEFDSPRDVLDHIRLTGVNSLGTALSPVLTRRLLREYPVNKNGRYSLTYQPIYIIMTKI